MIRTFLAVVSLYVSANSLNAYTEALSLVMEQWDLRGNVGDAKVHDLMAELKAMRMPHRGHEQDEETFRNITGQLALESAYAHHVRIPEIVQERVDGGMEFVLLMNGASERMFKLVYLYGENGLVKSAKIESLPTGWTLRKEETEYPLVFVTTERDEVYSFDLTKPFTAVYWGPLEPSTFRSDKPLLPKEL